MRTCSPRPAMPDTMTNMEALRRRVSLNENEHVHGILTPRQVRWRPDRQARADMFGAMSVLLSCNFAFRLTDQLQVNPEVRNALESVFHGILHKIDLFESTPSLSETSSNEGISSATSRPKSQAKQAQQRSLQVQGPNKEQVIASELAKRIQRLRERETAHRNAALLDMNEASAIKKAAALKIAKVFHEDHHSEEEVYL
mmetsp:Transcript_11186/g.38074  ORF Transcript_11186/g.38074 Transcript_11186/m.38074 type:complete len:199 (+) Transcript_11186:484-1080(+)